MSAETNELDTQEADYHRTNGTLQEWEDEENEKRKRWICKRCSYEGQDTSEYDGYCYECYADINNIEF